MVRLLGLVAAVVLAGCGERPGGQGGDAPVVPEVVPAERIAGESAEGVVFIFATADEGAIVVTAEEGYTAELQPREIAIRAGDTAARSFADLQPAYAADVEAWTEEEKDALRAVIAGLMPKIEAVDSLLPETVLLVKTGEVVEGGLPHTRGNAIIFAGGGIPSGGPLKALFLHELHHVLSRANAELHDDYFAIIGFEPCRFEEPAALREIRLSNPDAPTYRHYVPAVPGEGAPFSGADGVIPYLFTGQSYNGSGRLPDYFGFGLLPVSVGEGTCTALAERPNELLQPGQVPAFGEMIGENTGYVIHPEETLADNFVFWALERADLPDPEIPAAVGAFWTEAAARD